MGEKRYHLVRKESPATGKKECFVSQCHDDRELVAQLQAVLNAAFDPEQYAFFNTQQGGNDTAGKLLDPTLLKHLNASDLMIAVMTDSYVRSAVCIAELSYFWLRGKPVIPLVFSPEAFHLIKEDFGINPICIDLTRREPGQAASLAGDIAASMRANGFVSSSPAAFRESLTRLLTGAEPACPRRPFLGSRRVYAAINSYCADAGILRMSNHNLSSQELIEALAPCREIYILATTGSSLVTTLSASFLTPALASGARVFLFLPNRYSDYIADVAEIESPKRAETRKQDFATEFSRVINALRDCLLRSRRINPEAAGEVYVGCAYTLLRQTVTLGVNGDRLWGWLSMTMPPGKTLDGTPSFELEGEVGKPSIAAMALDHLQAIRRLAERRGCFRRLSESEDFESFYLEGEAAEAHWKEMYARARDNTMAREDGADLIEVAAQHPLRPDGTPAAEFARRLDRAVSLYHELTGQGHAVRIYVPGSLHCHKGKADSRSLSDAGVAYLLEKGISEEDLLGNGENIRYKGDLGVYNTADECYVAAQIFLNGDYRRLHCVCSPNQLVRKKLFYIAFGVIPYYYTVNCTTLFHDDLYELFHSVPDVLYHDNTWQAPDSFNGNRTRRERDPRYALPGRNGPPAKG